MYNKVCWKRSVDGVSSTSNAEQGQCQSLGRLLTAVSSCVFMCSPRLVVAQPLRGVCCNISPPHGDLFYPLTSAQNFPSCGLWLLLCPFLLWDSWVFSIMTSRYLEIESRFPPLIFVFSGWRSPAPFPCHTPAHWTFQWSSAGFLLVLSYLSWVSQKWKQQCSQCNSWTPNSKEELLPLTHVCTCSLEFCPCKGANDSQHVMIHSSGEQQQFSLVGRTESKERLIWRREKATGYLSISLSFMVFGLTSWENPQSAYMKVRVCAAPLPAFGSGMPVFWNNFETTEINSAISICGFGYFWFFYFQLGFLLGDLFVCLFFNMPISSSQQQLLFNQDLS